MGQANPGNHKRERKRGNKADGHSPAQNKKVEKKGGKNWDPHPQKCPKKLGGDFSKIGKYGEGKWGFLGGEVQCINEKKPDCCQVRCTMPKKKKKGGLTGKNILGVEQNRHQPSPKNARIRKRWGHQKTKNF